MATERPSAPRVSVVIAVRNAASTIGRALDSVLDQDYAHVEVIVIDGASTDATVRAIEERANRIAYWVSEPDLGVYDAWNKALPHTAGEWTMFLGADDVLAGATVLSRMAPHLAAAPPRYRVAYATVDVVAADGSTARRTGQPWEVAGPMFREHMSIAHPGVFHRRSLFVEHGQFDDSYRISGDYEFLLRELLDHDARFVPDLTVVKMGAGGLSDDRSTMVQLLQETYRARFEHGLVRIPPWRSFSLLRATTHARLAQAFGRRTADRVGDLYRAATRTGKQRSKP